MAATKLVITSSAVSGPTTDPALPEIGPITIQQQDGSSLPVNAGGGGVTVTLSSTSGTGAFSATDGGSTVTTVSIPSGQSSVTAWYGDTAIGTPTITAAAGGLTSATQVVTVVKSEWGDFAWKGFKNEAGSIFFARPTGVTDAIKGTLYKKVDGSLIWLAVRGTTPEAPSHRYPNGTAFVAYETVANIPVWMQPVTVPDI